MIKMLITFFDMKGAVHFQFISQDQTVVQTYYVEILKRLREAVHRKIPELWPGDWIFHHENAPAHKADRSLSSNFWPKNRFLKENDHSIPLILIRMASALNGRRFQDTEDI
jgi:hypothetical protein